MVWTVEYRDKTGARTSCEVEAEDRNRLFKTLSEKGISAIRVTEGIAHKSHQTRGIKKPRTSASGNSNGVIKGIAAGGIIIAAVAATLFFVFRNGPVVSDAAPDKKTSLIKDVTPAKADSSAATETNSSQIKNAKTADPQPGSVYTNQLGQEVHVAKDGTRSAVSTAWARRLKEQKEHPRKEIFRHMSESYMAMFLNPAEAVPPPPCDFTDEDVQNMLVDKIVIDPEKDTEDEIRQKQGVIAMKEELVQWYKEGGNFNSYLKELQHRQDLEAEQMHQARQMITEAMEKGDVEEAKELYDKINEHFKAKNMPSVRVAPKYRKYLDERSELK